MISEKNKAIEYILSQLKKGRTDLEKIKREATVAAGGSMARNSELLAAAKGRLPKKTMLLLRKKPVRTLSGITTVALMIKPDGSCSHSCIYCPFTGKAAKSYTGEEPAALRARNAGFDPMKQIKCRLTQYEEIGHPTEKCEVILMGGTFLEMPAAYKLNFVKKIYDTMNCASSKNLQEARIKNETAPHRIVGLTIETRPDVCGEKQINEILDYGATRVELGVQHPNDKIYKMINRGHRVAEVVRATALLKDSSFKVLYHLMPGLPGSGRKKDLAMIRQVFSNEKFKPDMLKIYPTLVIEGTKLHKMVAHGDYTPYSSEEAADVIAEMFRYIPKYVRVMRIQRDIPAALISSGVKKSNLRELVDQQIEEKGIIPQEIRSREVGLTGAPVREMKIARLDYKASKGREIFLSYENDYRIAGFARLRIPDGNIFRSEITASTGLIRELHVYGSEERLGSKGKVQHTGIGKQLLKEAEEIARKEFGMDRMVVISGSGVREYYYKMGYKSCGPYVAKSFRK